MTDKYPGAMLTTFAPSFAASIVRGCGFVLRATNIVARFPRVLATCKRDLCPAFCWAGVNHLFGPIEEDPKKARFGAAGEEIVAHHQHTLMLHNNWSRFGIVRAALMHLHFNVVVIENNDSVRSQGAWKVL
jgi:hypothetical protein